MTPTRTKKRLPVLNKPEIESHCTGCLDKDCPIERPSKGGLLFPSPQIEGVMFSRTNF